MSVLITHGSPLIAKKINFSDNGEKKISVFHGPIFRRQLQSSPVNPRLRLRLTEKKGKEVHEISRHEKGFFFCQNN